MKTLKNIIAIIAIFSFASYANARDQIKIVGSSTVYPYATVVAEQFGKKGNKTPEEASMPLLKHPKKPNRIHYFQQFIKESQRNWKPYLFLEAF